MSRLPASLRSVNRTRFGVPNKDDSTTCPAVPAFIVVVCAAMLFTAITGFSWYAISAP